MKSYGVQRLAALSTITVTKELESWLRLVVLSVGHERALAGAFVY
jgi:hypothetical protein